jgi:voltage-gated potassium channel Kch
MSRAVDTIPGVAAERSLFRRLRTTDPRRTAARGREVLRRRVDTGRFALRTTDEGERRRELIVCGDDPLAHRLVEELVRRHRAHVTVLLTNRRRGHGPQIARLPHVTVVEVGRLDMDAFRQAGIARADALALVHQDDVGNVHAALQIQELKPTLRLVIRMFNPGLGQGVQRMFADCRVLSDAAMAAPAFVSAALGEVAPVHIRLPGRTLYVARRTAVRAGDVVCGLAVTTGDQPELLPKDQDRADLVLAVARGVATHDRTPGAASTPGSASRRWRRVRRRARLLHWRRRPLRSLGAVFNRKLRIAAVVLVALLLVGTAVLKVTRGVTWLNAAYLAMLDTLAGANADLGERPVVKVTETALTVISIALIPVITAMVVEAAVNARLALALGRLREPIAGHVVVVGLGNVGTRVIRRLHDLGVPAVAIDRDEDARGIPVARELGIPYIIGEANRPETLRAASVETCRALVVVSTDDVTNLETALQSRAIQPDLRVVLRLFDGDFAGRVQRAFGVAISRSVSYVAAPAFAAAMLEREVIGTVPVGRRVLLIAEVPVCAGSELDGATLADTGQAQEARVIALMIDHRRTVLWDLSPQRRLAADDVLFVVTTRGGLAQLLLRAGPPGTLADPSSPPI